MGWPHTTWKVHAEVVLLLGWGRAILLQVAHPLVAAGVAEHSGFLTESWGRWRRLYRTLSAMLTLTFGTEAEASRVASGINALHDRIHGRLAEPAGSLEAGRAYSAHDPALLRWVHATLIDSFLLTYQLYVGPLGEAERDRYCAEGTAIESLLGMPRGFVPMSESALRSYMDAMLASGEIAVTDVARRLARAVVSPPSPAPLRPGLAYMRLVTIGLLPPAIREAYGFSWSRRQEALLRHSIPLLRGLVRLTPSPLRHWPVARAAFRRVRRADRQEPSR